MKPSLRLTKRAIKKYAEISIYEVFSVNSASFFFFFFSNLRESSVRPMPRRSAICIRINPNHFEKVFNLLRCKSVENQSELIWTKFSIRIQIQSNVGINLDSFGLGRKLFRIGAVYLGLNFYAKLWPEALSVNSSKFFNPIFKKMRDYVVVSRKIDAIQKSHNSSLPLK